MKRIISLAALISAAASLPQAGQAKDDHSSHGARDSHDAHVHGIAQLLLTRDGPQLELILESPAANLVGFEHTPASAEDREAITQAVASLRDSELLFTFSGGGCTITDVQVTSPFEELDHAEHSDDDDHGDEHTERHSEFHVSYHYTCDANAELKQLETGLLTVFPAIEQLDVQWITERGQGAERLAGNDDTVRLQ